jgi:hypothetical protein
LYQANHDARKSSQEYTHNIDLELGEQRKEERSIHLNLCDRFWFVEFGNTPGHPSFGRHGNGRQIEFELGDHCGNDNRFGGTFWEYQIGSNQHIGKHPKEAICQVCMDLQREHYTAKRH